MSSVIESYLEKRALFDSWIRARPSEELAAIIIIPAHREYELIDTLESLLHCSGDYGRVEVIVVLNEGEKAAPGVNRFHAEQLLELEGWKKKRTSQGKNSSIIFHFIHAQNLPHKKAGVGLARKIGLDEAVRRWNQIDKNGPVICLDADTVVTPNYLFALVDHFRKYPKCPGIGIRYEHPLEGLKEAEQKAIINYELHLRYFLHAKRWTGFPYAYETVGSAMAVRAIAYAQQGGMNTRKAGEDFYFLNKFIPLDHFAELNTTTVYPSARISDRVPFGTGRAVGDMLQNKKEWLTYPPEAFQLLRSFFANLPFYFEQPTDWKLKTIDALMVEYLEGKNCSKVLAEIKSNTSSFEAFEKRFYRWFDAFQIMKCLHYFEEKGMERVAVETGAVWLLAELNINIGKENVNIKELLSCFRQLT